MGIAIIVPGSTGTGDPVELPSDTPPITPTNWWRAASVEGVDGAKIGTVPDSQGTLALSGFGGSTNVTLNRRSYGTWVSTPGNAVERLQATLTGPGPGTIIALVRAETASNTTLFTAHGYQLQRITSLEWSMANVGKVSTNYVRVPGSQGWTLVAMVMNGATSRLHAGETYSSTAGTVDGTGTVDNLITLGSGGSQIADFSEVMYYNRVLGLSDVDEVMEFLTQQNPGLLP